MSRLVKTANFMADIISLLVGVCVMFACRGFNSISEVGFFIGGALMVILPIWDRVLPNKLKALRGVLYLVILVYIILLIVKLLPFVSTV